MTCKICNVIVFNLNTCYNFFNYQFIYGVDVNLMSTEGFTDMSYLNMLPLNFLALSKYILKIQILCNFIQKNSPEWWFYFLVSPNETIQIDPSYYDSLRFLFSLFIVKWYWNNRTSSCTCASCWFYWPSRYIWS